MSCPVPMARYSCTGTLRSLAAAPWAVRLSGPNSGSSTSGDDDYQSRDTDTAVERNSVRRQLDRLKELYLLGDLTMSDYKTRKAALADRLAALLETGNQDADAGKRLSAFLGDVGSAWIVANAEERNRLAQQLFASVVVQNRAAVALLPRPDLLPFFEGVTWCIGGSDGGPLREIDAVSPPLVPYFYPEHVLRSRSRLGVGRYAAGTKPRRIPEDRWLDVVTRARSESLRSIARDYNVSHETVRGVLLIAGGVDAPQLADWARSRAP